MKILTMGILFTCRVVASMSDPDILLTTVNCQINTSFYRPASTQHRLLRLAGIIYTLEPAKSAISSVVKLACFRDCPCGDLMTLGLC